MYVDNIDNLQYVTHMGLRKIATNLPDELLHEAVNLTGLNQTQTIVEGLKELIAKKKREVFLALQGKIHIRVNTDKTRERRKI